MIQNQDITCQNGTNKAVTSRSLGPSPRIYPRPKYPSAWLILWQFAAFAVVQQGLFNGVMTKSLAPFYKWTREVAKDSDISDAVYFSILLSGTHLAVYIAANLPFFCLDNFKLLQSYKLFRKSFMMPSKKQLLWLALEQAFSLLIIGPTVGYALYHALFLQYQLLEPLDAPIPTLTESAFIVFALSIVNDSGFYVVHRSLHCKAFYKHIHKKHHEFVGTVGYAAEHAHPVEQILANYAPLFGGIFLVRCHPLCFAVFLGSRVYEAYEGHSGYCFLGYLFPDDTGSWWGRVLRDALSKSLQAAHHDHHHTYNCGNFGVFYLDWIFGTSDHYQNLGGFQGYLDLKSQTDAKKV